MLRMTIHDQAGVASFVVETDGFCLKTCEAGDVQVATFAVGGRLAGMWVKESGECWESVLAAEPSRAMLVNLASVALIGPAWRELLNGMQRKGAKLLSAGRLMNAIAEEIEAKVEKGELAWA